MNEANDKGFWARWSRRKRDAGDVAEGPEEAAPMAEAVAADAAPPAAERPACPIPNLPAIDPASLPSIDELTPQSDFSLFLRPGVPAALRSAALRRMWSLDPAIRDFIEVADYQWDFNTVGGLPLGFAGEFAGDVKKLLAQAIGQPDDAEAPEPPRDAQADGMAEAGEASLAAPAPVEAPPIAESTAPRSEPQDATAAVSARRRHGGALPA
jgi:hypothetical protein